MSIITYEEKQIIFSHLTIPVPKINFHLHEGYEIYFLISGDVQYFVEKTIYPIEYGDVMFTNKREIHKPNFLTDKLYERFTLEFDPELVRPFNSEYFDLLQCFEQRPLGEQNRIRLAQWQTHEIIALFTKMEEIEAARGSAWEILRLNVLIEILVWLNRAFIHSSHNETRFPLPDKLVEVLDYIEFHLAGDLSLDTLERKFAINRFHLSKVFKKAIGSSIHNYILYKRISRAKTLLVQGNNVSETLEKCGFHDYSHFLKLFKQTVGKTPGEYRRR